MSIVSWTPFGDLDNLLERSWGSLGGTGLADRLRLTDADLKWRPAADIIEKKKEYLIKADLPEVKKEDIEVSVADNMLTIKGERRFEKEAEEETQHRRETFHGVFERRFSLPDDVDVAGVSADCKDGVLKVHLPRVKRKKTESLEIKVK